MAAAATAHRVRSATSVATDGTRVELGRTPSHKHLIADAKQLVFKTSSIALLRAKGHNLPPGDYPAASADGANLQSSYLKGAKLVLDYMNELWRTQKLCDVIIPCDKGEIKAHKIALGAFSESLTRKFSEFPQGEVMCIDMSDFSYSTIYSVLNFLYTTEINITQENVGAILRCASELGIEILIHISKNYLNNLNVDNALPYYSIAETYHLEDIRQSIYQYICKSFSDITKTQSFVLVPFDKMVTLICDDAIFGSELEVFRAVVRWVDYNRQERMPIAPSLLRCVRFHKISPEDLVTKCECVSWIFEPRECHNILYEAFKYHALMLSGSSLATSFPLQRTRSGTTNISKADTGHSTGITKYINNSSHYTKDYVSSLSQPPTISERDSRTSQPYSQYAGAFAGGTPPPPPYPPAVSPGGARPLSPVPPPSPTTQSAFAPGQAVSGKPSPLQYSSIQAGAAYGTASDLHQYPRTPPPSPLQPHLQHHLQQQLPFSDTSAALRQTGLVQSTPQSQTFTSSQQQQFTAVGGQQLSAGVGQADHSGRKFSAGSDRSGVTVSQDFARSAIKEPISVHHPVTSPPSLVQTTPTTDAAQREAQAAAQRAAEEAAARAAVEEAERAAVVEAERAAAKAAADEAAKAAAKAAADEAANAAAKAAADEAAKAAAKAAADEAAKAAAKAAADEAARAAAKAAADEAAKAAAKAAAEEAAKAAAKAAADEAAKAAAKAAADEAAKAAAKRTVGEKRPSPGTSKTHVSVPDKPVTSKGSQGNVGKPPVIVTSPPPVDIKGGQSEDHFASDQDLQGSNHVVVHTQMQQGLDSEQETEQDAAYDTGYDGYDAYGKEYGEEEHYAEENGEHYGEEHYGDEHYGEEPYGDEHYGDDQYGEGEHYEDDQYGEQPYGDDQYGEAPYGDDQYGEAPYGDDQYADQPYDDQYGELPYGDEQYADDAYGAEGYGEEHIEPDHTSAAYANQPGGNRYYEVASAPATANPSIVPVGRASTNKPSDLSMTLASQPGSAHSTMLQVDEYDKNKSMTSQLGSIGSGPMQDTTSLSRDLSGSRRDLDTLQPIIETTAGGSMQSIQSHMSSRPFRHDDSGSYDKSGVQEPVYEIGSKELAYTPSMYRDGLDGPPANNLVMVGGVDLQSLDPDVPGRCVFSLHHDTHEWEELGSLDEYTHHHGVAVVDGQIYVIGGAIYDYKRPDMLGGATANVYVYRVEMEVWEQVASMSTPRAYFQVVMHRGLIYAVGGEDDERITLDTIEKYDPGEDYWQNEVVIPVGGFLGSAVVVFKESIFVVGGYQRGKPANVILSCVNSYNIQNKQWTPKGDLNMPRCHAGLVVVKGTMYLVGGRCRAPDGLRSLTTIEQYNDANDVWQHIADLHEPRHDAAVAAVGNWIYVVGGMQTPSPYCLDTVECYDVVNDEWEQLIEMPYPASGVAATPLFLADLIYDQ